MHQECITYKSRVHHVLKLAQEEQHRKLKAFEFW